VASGQLRGGERRGGKGRERGEELWERGEGSFGREGRGGKGGGGEGGRGGGGEKGGGDLILAHRLVEEQHAADKVGRGDALCTLALAVPARQLHLFISVAACG